jgi:Ca-activated chloride channel family protein
MTDTLELSHKLSYRVIPNGDSPRLLYLLIELQGGQASEVRVPVHLALVVDKSDSMMINIAPPELIQQWAAQGYSREVISDGIPIHRVDLSRVPKEEIDRLPRQIDFVKQALRAVVEILGAQDRFALVLFAGHALTVVPLSDASRRRMILDALDAIEQAQLGDDTYMGRGMTQGLQELVAGGDSAARDPGAGDPAAVRRMVVLTDGYTLDEADCRVFAQRARAQGVSISTMGLGNDFNEDIMIPLADETGGHAYRMDSQQEIMAAFRQELEAVQSIAYRNLELKLRVSQGVELRTAHRVLPVISHLGSVRVVERSASIELGNYELNAPPALLLELVMPPKTVPGVYRLAQLVLAYEDPDGAQGRQTLRQDIVVECSAEQIQPEFDPRVMSVVERVTTFKLQTRAIEDARQGDIAGATRKLQAAATRLLDMGEMDLAQTMQQQAEELDQQGEIAAGTAKAARYRTRKLTRKLG